MKKNKIKLTFGHRELFDYLEHHINCQIDEIINKVKDIVKILSYPSETISFAYFISQKDLEQDLMSCNDLADMKEDFLSSLKLCRSLITEDSFSSYHAQETKLLQSKYNSPERFKAFCHSKYWIYNLDKTLTIELIKDHKKFFKIIKDKLASYARFYETDLPEFLDLRRKLLNNEIDIETWQQRTYPENHSIEESINKLTIQKDLCIKLKDFIVNITKIFLKPCLEELERQEQEMKKIIANPFDKRFDDQFTYGQVQEEKETIELYEQFFKEQAKKQDQFILEGYNYYLSQKQNQLEDSYSDYELKSYSDCELSSSDHEANNPNDDKIESVNNDDHFKYKDQSTLNGSIGNTIDQELDFF